MTDSPPRSPPARGLLTDLRSARTYLNVFYLLLAFPLGLAYFVFFTVGVSLGFSLAIVWVGLPILLVVLTGLLGFADVERVLAARMLGARVSREPRAPREEGLWAWVRQQIADASTWKALLYLLLKLPLGVASFVLTIVPLALTVVFFALPVAWAFNPGDITVFDDARVLTMPGAVALLVAGFGMALFSGAVVNGLAYLWCLLSTALLSDPGEGRRAQQEVRALTRTASIVAFAGTQEETLGALVAQAVEATGARACLALTLDTDPLGAREWRVGAAYGLPDDLPEAVRSVYATHANVGLPDDLTSGRARVSRDVRRAWQEDARYAPLHGQLPLVTWDAVVSLPLVYRGATVGRLDAFYPLRTDPTRRELDFLVAVADQAAVAVENARLFTRAQMQASLEERQRIARELHDSVSQALYGITLGVKTARAWLDRDPARAVEPLEYALSLAEGGTAEMKALLFALRPEALAEEGLVVALQKHAAALSARYKLHVTTHLADEPDVPLGVKQGLYRITQEALHNIVKHARASSVTLTLTGEGQLLTLGIRDDGQGFDPRQAFPGHMGLKSMRDRAQSLGGRLDLQTAPGAGVHLRVLVPVATVPGGSA